MKYEAVRVTTVACASSLMSWPTIEHTFSTGSLELNRVIQRPGCLQYVVRVADESYPICVLSPDHGIGPKFPGAGFGQSMPHDSFPW